MRTDGLQQIESAEGVTRHGVPETVVPARPHQPYIPADDFVGGERGTAVHIVEIIVCGVRKAGRGSTGQFGLVQDRTRLRLLATA